MITLSKKELAALALQQKHDILLALDQSTKISGYAFFEDGKLKNYGHLSFSGDYVIRIHHLKNWLLQVINDNKDNNLKIIIEDIQLQSREESEFQNALTFKRLAQVQGVLLEAFVENNVSYDIISPSVWRKNCGITSRRREEQKKEAQNLVKEKFDVEATEDEADAICIGLSTIKEEEDSFNWS